MLPSTYRPRLISDFIGPAQAHARLIERLASKARIAQDPLSLMLLGPPGVGKSQLAAFFIACLGADPKWGVVKINGTGFRIEDVEQYARDIRLTNWFDGYQVLWLEEVDKVPHVAQVRALTLLDDLPKRHAVVATSNCAERDLEDRFQSRWTVLKVEPPSGEEVFGLLQSQWPEIPAIAARMIAECACGNVRQALKDADTEWAKAA